MADAPKPAVVDDPTVRPVFTSKVISTVFDGGTIVATLGDVRLMPPSTDQSPKQGTIYVTTRLALTPTAAVELVQSLGNLLKHLAAQQTASRDALTSRAPQQLEKEATAAS
jgi:hypothetical protein